MASVPAFFSGLKTKTIYRIRIMSEKVYTKHVIIIYSNVIWHTVSRLVDEIIPSDHPLLFASQVIRWYDLIIST